MSATPERAAFRGAPLPSGTVTFAFTDIEGSTVRWERDCDAMQDALRRHDAILRDTLTGHGGYVFKTIGDAFCAAFSRAEDAVAALIAAQHALAAQDFSAVDGLRIRAAIHTGATEERDGDYFGPPVNRVARLLGIAYGGQVLVSGTTTELIAGTLPDRTSLRDLGRHRLKDLVQPERVFQLVAPGLGADFPPLRSLETMPNNLPLQMTPLVGRANEVLQIAELVRSHPLVTVVGAGGIGKTRTTLQVGANLLDSSGDGVWFVELAPLGSGDYIPSTVAQAMDLRLGGDGDPIGSLVRALKDKRALLIFDNCEHVIDGASRAIGALLRGCPELRILASSRQALGIAGEATFRLPSLDTPPPSEAPLTADEAASWAAIALFAERASAAEGRFALTDANAAIVADICRRLDGIPLAIELAAARVKILSPKQLRGRLDERFRLLTGGRRDVLPRQQTLHALIDWSFDLLDGRERALFSRLGVFVDAFTLEAAAAVGEGDEFEVLDVLGSLVDKSLMLAEPSGETMRYRLLESTRAYACEKLLAAGEQAVAANAHATHFAAVAAQAYLEFDSRLPAGWLEGLEPDLADLRAALEWALAGAGDRATGAQLAADCGPIFLRMELLGEGLRWCEAARGLAPLPDATAGRIEYVASMLHNNLGHRRALDCAERAVWFYERSDDERGLVRALSQVAQQYARAARFDEAIAPAAEAIRRARALGEPRVLVSVLRRCGYSLPATEIETARSYFSEGLGIARAIEDPEEACIVLEWWADREAAAGSLSRAIDLATEGLACAGRNSEMFLESHIAGWMLALDRLDDAAPHARRAFARAMEADNPLLRAHAIAYCAPQVAARDPDQAAMLFGYATTRLAELEWDWRRDGGLTFDNASRAIERTLGGSEFATLLERGGAWTETQAVAVLKI
jgi:predicted ATPase/class 3 adenylate cyclase